ncbi:MAG TPA: hypothetical protein VNS32_05300 [Flavisolibacter sp.]|nr:hypothetical protein [Flavisolibacter sp.]
MNALLLDSDKKNSIWFTKEHMKEALTDFLQEQGYTVYVEEADWGVKTSTLLFAFRPGNKEIIEVQGNWEQLMHESTQEWFGQEKYFILPDGFIEQLYKTLCNTLKRIQSKQLPVHFCIPDLPVYRDLLQKVGTQATGSAACLHVYLVD